MEPIAPLSGSSDSHDVDELSAFEVSELLDALEQERAIVLTLISESEQLATRFVRTLDASRPEDLTFEGRAFRERTRAHLMALRAFIGGGLKLNTRES